MPLPKFERFIYVAELRIRPSPKSAPLIDINYVFAILEKQKNKFPLLKIDDEKVILILHEFKLTKSHAIFLFQIRNENIADQIQQHKTTRKSRAFPRQDGEAPALSAHMVVSLLPTEKNGDAYTVLIENVPAIGRTLIIRYLREIFEKFCAFDIPDEKTKKNKEQKKYRPYPELLGHKSNTLQDALKQGAIFDELLLTKQEIIETPLGDAPYVREKDFTLTVKMQPNLTGAKGIEAMISAVAKWKGTYDTAKVKITPKSGKPKVTLLDLEKENVTHQLCILQEVVEGFKKPLSPCEDDIRMDLVQKMIECSPE